MTSFFDTVIEVLRQDERFFTAGGELLRNAVYEAAMKMDSALLKLLYNNEATSTFADMEWAKNALKKRRKKIKEIEREFDTELDKLPDDGDMDLLREYAESLDRYCRPLMTEEEYWSVLRRAKDRILTYEVIIKEMLRAIAERKEELDSAEGLDDFEKGRQLAYWEVMDIINTRHEIIQELLEED